jgi:hypothetical protein
VATLAGMTREPLHVLAYGKPGSGKTIFAHTFPRTRTLDFDKGMRSVLWAIRQGIITGKTPEEIVFATIVESNREKRGAIKKATALDQATDQLDEWLAEDAAGNSWDTLIGDSGTTLSDFTINKGLDENARLDLSKSKAQSGSSGMRVMRMQDWGSGSSLFQSFMDWCRSINKNFVLVCHEYESTNDNGTVVGIEPLLIGQLRQRIVKDFDEVYYAHTRRKGVGSGASLEYVLQTTNDSLKVCKSRLGCLEPIIPASYGYIKKKMDEYYG